MARTSSSTWPAVGRSVLPSLALSVLLLAAASLLLAPEGARAAGGECHELDMQLMNSLMMAPMMKDLYETTWQGMVVKISSMAPESFLITQGTRFREVEALPADAVHLMVTLVDEKTGQPIPYAAVWATVTDPRSGEVVFDERMWPMISCMGGVHYGVNVSLPRPGRYEVQVQVGPPQLARHREYADRWLGPQLFKTRLAVYGF